MCVSEDVKAAEGESDRTNKHQLIEASQQVLASFDHAITSVAGEMAKKKGIALDLSLSLCSACHQL